MKQINVIENVEHFLVDNPFFTRLLYFVGFLTSGYITWSALASNSQSKWVWLSYTIVMESGKAIMYLQYVSRNNKGFFYMWLVLTFFSITASMTFLVVENNTIENQVTYHSIAYSQAKDKESRIKQQIQLKQKLLDDSIAQKNQSTSSLLQDKQDNNKKVDNYNSSIKDLQQQINAKNDELQDAIHKKYVTMPSKIRTEIEQLQGNLAQNIKARDNLKVTDNTGASQNNINSLNVEIDQLNNQLNSIDYSTLPQEKATSGFYALFQFFGINNRFIFWLQFLFTLAITTTFEVLICMLYSISKTGHIPHLTPTPPKDKKPIPTPNEAPKEVIPPREAPRPPKESLVPSLTKSEQSPLVLEIPPNENLTPPKTYTNNLREFKPRQNHLTDDMKIYLQYVRDNIKDSGEIVGRNKISEGTGLSIEKCRAIYSNLKDMGILEPQGKKTILKRDVI
jgi:hypothetical protein